LNIFSKIAEQRIRKAIENGAFDNLEGSGKPILLEDETWIPEDLRPVYRVLKNAGCIPPELELRKEVLSLGELIHTLDDDRARMKKIRELNFKLLKLNEMRKRPLDLDRLPEYEEKIVRKFTDTP
jgi:hypothetical protein